MEKELNYLSEKIDELESRKDGHESMKKQLTKESSITSRSAIINLIDKEIELLHSILSAVTYFELGSDC